MSSGLDVRADIRSKTSAFGELIYVDKQYVPMFFQENNDYVYYSPANSCRTLEQTMKRIDKADSHIMSIIKEAQINKQAKVYKGTPATNVELYSPKRLLL